MSVVENVDVWRLPIDANAGVKTGDLERVTDDVGSDRLRNVSDDGCLVFIASRTKRDEVWLKNLKQVEKVESTYGGGEGHPSARMEESAYTRTKAGKRRVEIIDTAGGPPAEVCQDCYGPSDWSRDGTRLLIGTGLPSRSRAFTYDIPSGHIAELFAHPQWSLFFFRFSPDAQWVTFHTANSPNVRQIYAAPVSPGRPDPSRHVDEGGGRTIPATHEPGRLTGHCSITSPTGDKWFCPGRKSSIPRDEAAPVGSPRAVHHLHDPRLRATSGAAAFNDVEKGYLYMSLTEATGNIWLLDNNER